MSMNGTGMVDTFPLGQPAVSGAHALDLRAERAAAAQLRVGVIGYGYWGPNIVRNFHGLETGELVAVCDKSQAALRRAHQLYPQVTMTTDFTQILNSPQIDAVAVVTPVWTHYEFAKAALLKGKHVFVEKPFTSNSA